MWLVVWMGDSESVDDCCFRWVTRKVCLLVVLMRDWESVGSWWF